MVTPFTAESFSYMYSGAGLERVDAIHPHAGEVIAGRAESDRLTDGGSTRLKPGRRWRVGASIHEDVLDHLAAAHPRGHRLRARPSRPTGIRARGAAHLVPTGDDPVHAQRLHVHGHVRDGLARVEHHLGAVLFRELYHCGDVQLAAQHVADVRGGDEHVLSFTVSRSSSMSIPLWSFASPTWRRVAPVCAHTSCQGTRLE